MNLLIGQFEKSICKQNVPDFSVGDTIRVATKIVEGDKERIQVFQGTVIARKGGGLRETIALHRIAYGEGMEKTFLLHSPKVVSIEVVKRGKVRRARLYYLRGKTGKAAKIKERIVKTVKNKENAVERG